MPIQPLDIESFLERALTLPVLDVRSPAEYAHAHIPGALSMPLFTDEQRKVIGTAYKKESRQAAVDLGLGYFAERMKEIHREYNTLVEQWSAAHHLPLLPGSPVLLYCWRGGMRSGAVAWLLNLYGIRPFTLNGGYKAFRRWVLGRFELNYRLHVIGGYTGSGKTEILAKLRQEGLRTIDLEALASHRGSAFGSLGQEAQPSAELFENRLALALYRENAPGPVPGPGNELPVWLEDESMHIGSVGIPRAFWNQMRESPLYFLDIPFDERLNHIVAGYGKFDPPLLEACILKIQKRLGGQDTKNALNFLREGDLAACFTILLRYYDKLYHNSLHNRQNLPALLNKIPCTGVDRNNAAKVILQPGGSTR